MSNLAIIPARKGSKGLPGKNTKLLAGKPMIAYTIEAALESGCFQEICVSTNDEAVVSVAAAYPVSILERPAELATDTASSEDVVRHVLSTYQNRDQQYENICLLQATSPLRSAKHIQESFGLWQPHQEMLVSVYVPKGNPYNTIVELGDHGALQAVKPSQAIRRQDVPTVYEYNGGLYWMRTQTLLRKSLKELQKYPYVMPAQASVDVDDQFDFDLAEWLLTYANNHNQAS